jgi:hypothetical protein
VESQPGELALTALFHYQDYLHILTARAILCERSKLHFVGRKHDQIKHIDYRICPMARVELPENLYDKVDRRQLLALISK